MQSTRSAAFRTAASKLDFGPYPVSLVLAGVTCALAPAYIVRWHLGPYPTTLLEDAIVLTVVAFVYESWRLRTMPNFSSPFTLPAVLFVVAGAISVVVAPDRRAALGIYRAYLIEPIAFFFVVSAVASTWRRAAVVLAGLGLAGLVVGVANSVFILDALRNHRVNAAVTAPVVIYTNANDIALFLVPLIAIAASITFYRDDQRERVVSGAFLVVAVIATLLSFSRGGYLALAVVAIGLALSHRYRWRMLGAAVAIGIVLVLIPPIHRRIAVELDFSNPQNTLVGRFELWRVSLQMLQHHVLFGAGLSGFAQTIAPYWNPTHTDRFIYPHNIVLTFWSETGLLGLVAFVWIMFTGFRLGWRGWRQAVREWRPLQLGVTLALVAVIAHGLVDVPYFKNDLALEFWALMGLAWAGNRWGLSAG
ncbi:MAG TPA: O-antigen ligase family protein [Candidatus Dormibacteraeota bacterium]|nr:O-antigen ligase family protein [Candidatus Dormibacteraeota bacterium]